MCSFDARSQGSTAPPLLFKVKRGAVAYGPLPVSRFACLRSYWSAVLAWKMVPDTLKYSILLYSGGDHDGPAEYHDGRGDLRAS